MTTRDYCALAVAVLAAVLGVVLTAKAKGQR